MLRALRSGGIAQVLMGGIVAAIIAVFVLEFRAAGGQQTGSLSRQCVVELGRECFDARDFFAAYGMTVPAAVPPKQAKALNLRQHVLDGLIERELLVKQAEVIGVSTTPEALDDELAAGRAHVSLPAAESLRLGYMLDLLQGGPTAMTGRTIRELPVENPKTGQFDPEIYKRVVRNTARRSPKEFKNIQRRELIAARMRDLVRSRVRLSEPEAFEAFARERSKAVARTVRLDREWFARYAADASDRAAEAYASEHTGEIDEAWKQSKEAYAPGCILADEIFVARPPGSTDEDKGPLLEKIQQALKLLEGKEDFGTIARELSENPSSVIGGEVGCVTKESYGEGAETLIEALEKLKKGATSGTLETTRGFHIVRSRGPLSEDPATYGRRVIARQLSVMAQADKLSQDFGKALIAGAAAGTKLDELVKESIRTYGGTYAVARESGKAAGNKEVVDLTDPAALRDGRRPKVEISAPFTPGENPLHGVLPSVSPARIAFALEKAEDVHPDLIPLMDGYAVLQLKEKELATREDFDKEKDQVVQQLRLAKQNDALIAYVAALRESRKGDIRTNFSLVKDGSGVDSEE